MLMSIASAMTKEWRSVGIELGFKPSNLNSFEERYPTDGKQKIFSMFCKWKDKNMYKKDHQLLNELVWALEQSGWMDYLQGTFITERISVSDESLASLSHIMDAKWTHTIKALGFHSKEISRLQNGCSDRKQLIYSFLQRWKDDTQEKNRVCNITKHLRDTGYESLVNRFFKDL